MGLVEQALVDLQSFSSDAVNAFATPITFIAPNAVTVTVNGIRTKHHLGMNEEGMPVNAKKASISVSEALLISAGYPVRNSSNEVYLKGHQCKYKDSTGTLCTYVIREWYPDELLGFITCILGDFE